MRLLGMVQNMRILRDANDGAGGGVPERPAHVSESEWEGLSDFEREALTETDEGEGAHQIMGEEFTDDDLDEEALAEIVGEDTKTPEEEAAAVIAAAALAAGDTTAVVVPPVTTLPDYDEILAIRVTVSDSEVPLPDTVPEALQEKLTALKTEKAEARAKFGDGDLTRDQYDDSLDDISDRQDALNREIIQHQITQRDSKREELLQSKQQTAFFKAFAADYQETEADGKTFTDRSDAIYGAFLKQVDKLRVNPDWKDKPELYILTEADKRMRAALGLPLPGKAVAAVAVVPVTEKKPPAGDRKGVQTLATVPISEAEQVGNPFSAVLRLTGERLEKAIENMSPAQREQWEIYANRQG